MDSLVAIAMQVDDIPTVREIDSMLRDLGAKPKSKTNEDLLDRLLELRANIAA